MIGMSPRLVSILGLLALACTPKSEVSDQPRTTTQQDEPASTIVEHEPAQPSGEGQIVKLSQVETTLTVKTGTQLHYSYKSHASVGYGAKFEIGNPAVLEHLRTDMAYEQSEEERADKDGADKATGTFVFTAKSAGSSTLEVRELFRGDPELELEYAITVIDP
jgi:hypothetical protein